MKKYYKVFRVVGDELKSIFAHGKAEIAYRKREWNCSPEWLAELGYHPTFFNSPETARRFAQAMSLSARFAVWEVEVDEIVDLQPFRSTATLSNGYLGYELLFESWPPGTMMARRIKPIVPVAYWQL